MRMSREHLCQCRTQPVSVLLQHSIVSIVQSSLVQHSIVQYSVAQYSIVQQSIQFTSWGWGLPILGCLRKALPNVETNTETNRRLAEIRFETYHKPNILPKYPATKVQNPISTKPLLEIPIIATHKHITIHKCKQINKDISLYVCVYIYI